MNVDISTDPNRLDLDLIHRFLSEEAYWSPGVAREVVERALANSLCFGAYVNDRQVGLARVVTDRATFAWVADVFVVADYRRQGVGKRLMQAILDHPEMKTLRRIVLATRDAHSLYAQFGFEPLPFPDRFMMRPLDNAPPTAAPFTDKSATKET